MTFPERPLELSSSPLPGWGPGLACLFWECPMVASPPVLINTFPSLNPQKLDQLAPFLPWGQILGPLPLPSYLSSHNLCSLNHFLGWGSAMLPLGLPQICLAHSCGCKVLIYREGSVAAATPATAGLGSPPLEAACPGTGPLGFSFCTPLTVAKGRGRVRGKGWEDCPLWAVAEESEFAELKNLIF